MVTATSTDGPAAVLQASDPPAELVCVSVLGLTRVSRAGQAFDRVDWLSGRGARVAALSARHGRRVRLLSPPVGQDRDGTSALAELRRAGVINCVGAAPGVVTPRRDVWITGTGHVEVVDGHAPALEHLCGLDLSPLAGAAQVILDVDAQTSPLAVRVLQSLAGSQERGHWPAVALSFGGDRPPPTVVTAARRVKPVLVHTSLPISRPDRARALARLLVEVTGAELAIVTHGGTGVAMFLPGGEVLEPEVPAGLDEADGLATGLITTALARIHDARWRTHPRPGPGHHTVPRRPIRPAEVTRRSLLRAIP